MQFTVLLLSMAAYGGSAAYIDYNQRPKMNLIISVPHGGNIHPDNIPKRTIDPDTTNQRRGCYNATDQSCTYNHDNDLPNNCPDDQESKCKVRYMKDTYSKEIANIVADELEILTGGKRPYMVINNLRREYLDQNREVNEATFNDPVALTAYYQYESYLKQATATIAQNTNMSYGLLLGFHGITHSADWTEIGCRLGKNTLNGHIDDGDTLDPDKTSIRGLVSRKCQTNNTCFLDILYGDNSLGKFLIEEPRYNRSRTYRAVPSPADKAPGTEGYASGAYIIETFGSLNNPTHHIDALQLEMPKDARWIANERNNYAPALARAIKKFLDVHYPGAY